MYFFTVDDTILALEDITKNSYASIFENDFFNTMKQAHDTYGTCCNLALFYKTSAGYKALDDNFTLANVTDVHKQEFINNSAWLKMSPHAWEYETIYSYGIRDYFVDYKAIKQEVERFAGAACWFPNLCVIHFYNGVAKGIRQVAFDANMLFLVTRETLLDGGTSYITGEFRQKAIDNGTWKDFGRNVWHIPRACCLERALGVVTPSNKPAYAKIGDFLNQYKTEKNPAYMEIGTHEYYFTLSDARYNQSVVTAFLEMASWMSENGYVGSFPSRDKLFKFNWL